jgi:uncharacterized protein YjiS (DUF1127 family)
VPFIEANFGQSRRDSAGAIRRRTTQAFAGILAWWLECRSRAAQRRVLKQLSDHGLRDIGLSRAQADGESGKWPWCP